MTTTTDSTTYALPPTTRRIIPAACPVCGKAEFRAPQHKANHIAKCAREAQAADENAMADARIDTYRAADLARRLAMPRQPWREEI